jgi:uncharacterized protein YkwD
MENRAYWRHRRIRDRVLPLLLCIPLTVAIPPVSQNHVSGTKFKHGNTASADQLLNPRRLNRKLLEKTLIDVTNRVRERHRLDTCRYYAKLRNAARGHSEDMVHHDYFSHVSPVPAQRHLVDRIRLAGVARANTVVGENIGVDYYLKIADVPYFKTYRNGHVVYISNETDEVIGYQSYWEFSESMVDKWMHSPGHRENILNGDFDRIGIGVASGKYNGFDAIYVTQNFMGPLKPDQVNTEGRK